MMWPKTVYVLYTLCIQHIDIDVLAVSSLLPCLAAL